jgi:hypothetical protein
MSHWLESFKCLLMFCCILIICVSISYYYTNTHTEPHESTLAVGKLNASVDCNENNINYVLLLLV